MDTNFEIAERLKGLREMEEISVTEMAAVAGVSAEEYLDYESGKKDFSFTLLYKCAKRLAVDFTEIVTGGSPNLSGYSIVRNGEGLPINRRQGFTYRHIAQYVKNRVSEPFVVTAPYIEAEQSKPIALSTHEGQEMDYVLEGRLKIEIDGHTEILAAGDSVYYDSGKPHGMRATGGEKCVFLAIVMS